MYRVNQCVMGKFSTTIWKYFRLDVWDVFLVFSSTNLKRKRKQFEFQNVYGDAVFFYASFYLVKINVVPWTSNRWFTTCREKTRN
jgi:hypothetical protein